MARTTHQPSVLVGMSGGVDSSLAAALLVKRGYRVVGGFIKNWSDSKDLWTGECAWRGERRDAIRVAAKLGIPLLTFDFEKEYREKIVAELFRSYEAGETPNPDVLCNEYIKFGLFADEAKRLGFDYVATGHYARVVQERSFFNFLSFPRRRESGLPSVPDSRLRGNDILGVGNDIGSMRLLRGKDPDKDQSYFLYRVGHDILQKTLFPIGDLKKSEVRKLAEKLDLPVAQKPDSQGICFIGKLDMEEFLRKKIPSKPGEIVDEAGIVLGKHEGLDSYTIGQRQGIKVSKGEEPWYVADKNVEKNQLIVVQGAEHPRLFRTTASVGDLHWTRGEAPKLPFRCEVQVRYRQEPIGATVSAGAHEGEVKLLFAKPVKAVAPGQSAVLYKGDECLGGGVILPTK